MPALSSEVNAFLTRVKDSLRYGQDSGSRASATLASTAGTGLLSLQVDRKGESGNDWTYVVTVPAGTSALNVSATGTAITIALAVSAGVATAANTLNAIAAAINANVAGITASVVSGGTLTRTSAVSLTSFTGGADNETGVQTAPIRGGYLLAADLATALELLQEATNSGELTATGGSTTTAVVASLTSGAFAGATVTFESDTTTALLRGVTATVRSNNGTTLTFTEALPAAVVNTDTFRITQAFINPELLQLRGSLERGDSPAALPFGESRVAIDAMAKMVQQLAGSSLPNRSVSRPGLVTAAGSTTTVINSVDTMKIDAFKGYYLTIGGVSRRIVRNDETTLTVAPGFSVAPAGGVSMSIALQTVDPKVFPGRFNATLTVGHPDADFFALLLDSVQNVVEAFVLPS